MIQQWKLHGFLVFTSSFITSLCPYHTNKQCTNSFTCAFWIRVQCCCAYNESLCVQRSCEKKSKTEELKGPKCEFKTRGATKRPTERMVRTTQDRAWLMFVFNAYLVYSSGKKSINFSWSEKTPLAVKYYVHEVFCFAELVMFPPLWNTEI